MSTVQISVKKFSKIRRGARAWNKLFQRHTADTPEYFTERARVFRDHGLDGIESLFWDRKNNLHLINYYAQNVQYYGICVAEKLLLRQVNSLCNSMITDIHIAQQLKYLLCQIREANKCAFYSLEFSGDPLLGHMSMLETKLNQIFNRVDAYIECEPRVLKVSVPESPTELFVQIEKFGMFRGFGINDQMVMQREWQSFIYWVCTQRRKFKK